MNQQPDSEKQVEQVEQAPAEPLKVRTNVKAGQFGDGRPPDAYTQYHDPSYTAIPVWDSSIP